ncbi:AAA family ATPase [Streptomyces sp. NPDC015501]|uniref:AAA family ATPase n=1 Tax=unclassified Streptomyces TaxID=2593676 RepID=UPI0036FF74D4
MVARAMMCIHGGAGFGKTLAVNTCLRELEPGEDVRRVTFRARPTARAVRYELFTALDLAGELPRHPSEFDRLLKTALAERLRTFLVDEAQWLNGEAFECFRYLWEEPSTQLAIIFVGGEGCHTVLRCEPMLSSQEKHPSRCGDCDLQFEPDLDQMWGVSRRQEKHDQEQEQEQEQEQDQAELRSKSGGWFSRLHS